MRPLSIFVLLTVLAGCDIIRDQLDGNQPPVIETFEADPAQGEAPVLVGFSWRAVDLKGDALTCKLDFDDGVTETIENCGQVTNHFHEYTKPGGYVAVLRISDGTSSTSRSIAVRILKVNGAEI